MVESAPSPSNDVDAARLEAHVRRLCEWSRPTRSPGHAAARLYVAESLAAAGWDVERHEFRAECRGENYEGVNLVARHPRFRDDGLPRFCVGAHYDSIPDCAGADDNASAVAALLEIARVLPEIAPVDPRIEVELVSFDLEEIGILGGEVHARRCREEPVDLRGMVSLEMLGYRDHSPGSQSLPSALEGRYPDTGDFIAVIGNQVSGPLVEAFATGMHGVDGLPVETLQVPENGNVLQATRLSDHSPFWDAGFAAVMLTDTSFMRNPHYHTPGDVPDTLDYAFLHDVGRGALRAVRHIQENGLPSVTR